GDVPEPRQLEAAGSRGRRCGGHVAHAKSRGVGCIQAEFAGCMVTARVMDNGQGRIIGIYRPAARRPAPPPWIAGRRDTPAVKATIDPEMGRVKNTVQSFSKLIMEFMKFSSAIGPRMTPSTRGATGKPVFSKM